MPVDVCWPCEISCWYGLLGVELKLRGYAQEQYLRRVTRFVERCRSIEPLGGMWDVADFQWWWRDGGYEDPERQLFLETKGGEVRAMVLLSEAYGTFDYEVLPGLEETAEGLKIFDAGLRWLKRLQLGQKAVRIQFFVCEDHAAFRRFAEVQGFEELNRGYVQLALVLQGKQAAAAPGDNLIRVRCIEDRDFMDAKPPVLRTPARNFARVLQAPLYRRDQHLVAVGAENRVIGECIYWVDTENSIGVFEPVETKPEFRRKGVALALLNEGLRRMNLQGVRVAKVSHYSDNLPARNLYHSLGFSQLFSRLVYGNNL